MGLMYLYDVGVVYRDVKSSNVLLDGSWMVKIGDFGLVECESEL